MCIYGFGFFFFLQWMSVCHAYGAGHLGRRMDFSMSNWSHSRSKGTDDVKPVSGAGVLCVCTEKGCRDGRVTRVSRDR